jgi:hypothetical protein
MDLTKIYPYVVPDTYVERTPTNPEGFVLPLGHGVVAILVHDLDGVCRNVTPDELSSAGLTATAAHQQALSNLESLAEGPAINKAIYQGAGGTPFVIWSGHWLTASCIRVRGLHAFASKLLKTDTVCVSIPQREAMLLFPDGPKEQRDQMRALIQTNEQDPHKLVTGKLFRLTAAGVTPLVDS